MARKCDIGIKVGTGVLTDLPFVLVESPLVLSPLLREYETQEYPESSAAEILLKTSRRPFTYDMKLLYYGDSQSANLAIKTFVDNLFTATGDSLVPKSLEIYNYYKKEKIVGYCTGVQSYGFGSDVNSDVVGLDISIYVPDPNVCDFNMPANRISGTVISSMRIDLVVNTGGMDFTNVTIETSATGTSGWSGIYTGSNLTFSHVGLDSDTDYYYRTKTDSGAYSYTIKLKTL